VIIVVRIVVTGTNTVVNVVITGDTALVNGASTGNGAASALEIPPMPTPAPAPKARPGTLTEPLVAIGQATHARTHRTDAARGIDQTTDRADGLPEAARYPVALAIEHLGAQLCDVCSQ